MLEPLNSRILTHSLAEPMLHHHIIKLQHPDVRPLSNRRSYDVLLRKLFILSTVVIANLVSLYDEGGALDSQSSETQFMEHLVGTGGSHIGSIKNIYSQICCAADEPHLRFEEDESEGEGDLRDESELFCYRF